MTNAVSVFSLPCVSAVRKRKGSQDEVNSSDGSGRSFSNKKPRVFFSEDQKEVLRQAYQHDPYPNQASIEQLASQLGVGTKTVVNWFHNHRMRAKQHHSNAPSPARASPVCRTPLTPSSDQCDSSMDSSISRKPQVSTASAPDEESSASRDGTEEKENTGSQWIFPTYEPVPMVGHSSEKPPSHSPVANNNNKGEPSGEQLGGNKGGGNRRKSARPQWLYEGRQLDRVRNSTPDSDDPYRNSDGDEEMDEEEEEEDEEAMDSSEEKLMNGEEEGDGEKQREWEQPPPGLVNGSSENW